MRETFSSSFFPFYMTFRSSYYDINDITKETPTTADGSVLQQSAGR